MVFTIARFSTRRDVHDKYYHQEETCTAFHRTYVHHLANSRISQALHGKPQGLALGSQVWSQPSNPRKSRLITSDWFNEVSARAVSSSAQVCCHLVALQWRNNGKYVVNCFTSQLATSYTCSATVFRVLKLCGVSATAPDKHI